MILEDAPEFKVELGQIHTHGQLLYKLFKTCDLYLSVGVDNCQDGARLFWFILTITKVEVPITREDTLLNLRLLRENQREHFPGSQGSGFDPQLVQLGQHINAFDDILLGLTGEHLDQVVDRILNNGHHNLQLVACHNLLCQSPDKLFELDGLPFVRRESLHLFSRDSLHIR